MSMNYSVTNTYIPEKRWYYPECQNTLSTVYEVNQNIKFFLFMFYNIEVRKR